MAQFNIVNEKDRRANNSPQLSEMDPTGGVLPDKREVGRPV
jgi:hypothetical protein